MNRIIKKISKTFVWVMVLCLAMNTLAENKQNLYEATIKVSSQNDKARLQALPGALTQVLIKISGKTMIASTPKIKSQIKEAASFVKQYSYKNEDNSNNQYELTVEFNAEQVNELLQQANIPIWGEERPVTIAWIAIEDEKETKIYGVDTDPDISAIISQVSNERGLPLLLPMLDLEEMNAVGVGDITTPQPWKIQAASERYQTKVQVISHVYKDTTQEKPTWHSEWVLLAGNAKVSFEKNADELPQVIKLGINELADRLADQYTVVSTTNAVNQLTVAVYGVKGLNSYTKINNYLKNLPFVSELEVQTIGTDYVIFYLSVHGGEDILVQAFATDNLLTPIEYHQPEIDANLNYRLVS